MDNSVSRSVSSAYKLQACGDAMGDMFEVSVIRSDDFKSHKAKGETSDLVQTGSKVGGMVPRGHQGPCAFLIMASGLDKVR